ncbi:MAG: response regulator [Lachnospiraceae bacterium]|nr:response regulator [Lachnospiraceae bacterium]
MENSKTRVWRYYIAFFVMIAFMTIVVIVDIIAGKVTSQLKWESNTIENWTIVRSDGSREPIEFPARINSKRGESITIETTIPYNVRDNMWVNYYCQSSNKVYIGDRLRKSYDRMNTGVWGGAVNEVSLFLRVDSEDAGRTLQIVFEDPDVMNSKLYTVYYGDSLGIIINIFRKNAVLAILASMLIFAATVITIVDCAAAILGKRRLLVAHLSIGAIFASTWIVFNSRIFPLITGTYYINGTLALLALMIMPIPVIVYVDRMQRGRFTIIHFASAILSTALFIISTILHFTGSISFVRSEIAIELVLMVIFILEIVSVILDIRKGHLGEYKIIATGLGSAIILAFLEVIQSQLNIVDNEGFFLEIGLIVLLVSGFLQQIQENHASDLKREQALAANESKSSFLASMSHEIRTPINSIIGMNEMIIRENRDPQIREYANQVDRSGKMLLGLINDVLDFSKIEAGKMTILDVPYKTAPMLNDLVQLLNERTIAKSLKSGFDIARDIPSELSGDEIHIKQILVNLISNGVKYTKEGYVTLKVTAEKDEKQPGKIDLKFIVSDNGIGIKKENISTLFDRFTRLDEQRNRTIEGSGLGLSIVKRLLDEMHGTVSVESEYGKGSSFTVVIPQKVSDPEPIGDIREAIKKSSEESIGYVEQFHASKAKVLIVDDNLVNLRVASELLKRTKMQIDTATGGRECIYKCRDIKYDLILMDHRMPDPDGIETLHLLREDFAGVNYDTKVIVLTANVFAGIREKYIADGFVDYLSKPIDSELLEKCIIKHLDPSLIDKDLPQENKDEAPAATAEDNTVSASKDAADDSCSLTNREFLNKKADTIIKSAIGGTNDPIKADNMTINETPDIQKVSEKQEDVMDNSGAKRTLVERLRDIPGMDIDKTIERYGAKDDFLNILFTAIVNDGRNKAQEMKKYLAQKDYKDFGIEAHATKSSMATIYATEISERAKQHEFACKEERFDFVEEDGAAFVDDYLKFLDLVEAAMNGN